MLARLLALLLLPLLLSACGGDPLAQEVPGYHQQMDALMAQNGQMAQLFVKLVKDLESGQMDIDGAARTVEQQVLPIAQRLQQQVSAIQVQDPNLASLHQLIVDAWTGQAQAFQDLVNAWHAQDPQAFQAAIGRIRNAKASENDYVGRVNAVLERYGYHLDEFPTAD